MQLSAIAPHQADYLVALGRAIALAQNFEINCKFVFGVNDLGEAFAAKKIGVKAWQSYGKKLMKRSLGETLRGRDNDQIFKRQIPVLEAARVARNYLAHQAAEPALYVPAMSGKHKLRDLILKKVDRLKIEKERQEMVVSYLQKILPRFEKAIRDFAEGDKVVSEWSYIIQEKDAHMPMITETYVDDAVEWVLEPIHS
ncbi:MAG: hypothetical protein ACKVQU_02520 [Burkholderiales bacterium]